MKLKSLKKLSPYKANIKKIALFGGFLVILNILYPGPLPKKFILKPGDIAPKDIIAPHTFYIQKNKKELEEERKRAKESAFFVLREDKEALPLIKRKVVTFFEELEKIRQEQKVFNEKRAALISLIPSLDKNSINFLLMRNYKPLKDSLIKVLDEVLEQGVIASKKPITSPVVTILGEEIPRSVGEFLDFNEIPRISKERATRMLARNNNAISTFVTLATFFVKPNLAVDLSETLKKKEQAAAQVDPTKGIVLKDEMIVRAHDVVTEEVVDKISSLSRETSVSGISTFIGRNIIYLTAIFALFLYLSFFSSSLLDDIWKLFLLILLICLVMGAASFIISMKLSWYLIPVALFGVLSSLLLGTQPAVSGVITLTILISAYSGGGFEPLTLFLFSGIISVFVSTTIRKPSDFYKPVLYISGAYICTALGMELIKLSPPLFLFQSLGYATIGGVGSSFIAFGLLPIFERSFKITTPLTLLEYANPDHPILRNLSHYAPGTYHHSMTVATLAEAAARVIGANPLLARVGAYYHDIGKLKKPDYFIENQRGRNPHTKLSPELNARIVISHVREGAEIARKEKLPKEIIDIIEEHQGTTLVESFYIKAKESGKEINELDFRYPGPIPHTKESAIVMLADSVEATVRSLSDPTPSKIKGVIEDTIKKRVGGEQLSKVNSSFEELGKIGNSFLPVLVATFHQRIEYEKNLYKESKKQGKYKKNKA